MCQMLVEENVSSAYSILELRMYKVSKTNLDFKRIFFTTLFLGAEQLLMMQPVFKWSHQCHPNSGA